jgi:chromosome segregation ATPase
MAAFAIGGTLYQSSKMETLRRQIAAYQQDNNALRVKLVQSGSDLQTALNSLHQELADAKEEANTSLTMAQKIALQRADQLARRQKEQAVRLSAELDKVKQNTAEAEAKLQDITTDVGSVKNDVGSVKTEVGSVRTDVDAAKTNIDATNTELQRVRGDMGMMSGLIATNGKEIQMLRDLGDRNIYEFKISKSAGLQKVGDIQVVLRKTDVKRNRYTIEVLADDKRVEKKDKGTNEPVQFYTLQAHQPYELVVNQVNKDQIVGYLATPKVTVSRKQ